ncbi:TPA: hypothetical protein ACGUU0_004128 [Vibrio vulnificus]
MTSSSAARRTLHTFELSSKTDSNGCTVSNIVEVELSYNVGGVNYFSYTEERRGLYLSVSPYQIKQSPDSPAYQTKTYASFSGLKQCVLEMKRFSKKQLETFKPTKSAINQLLDAIVQKNGLNSSVVSIECIDPSLYS